MIAAVALTAGCIGPAVRPGDELRRRGDEIVACGRLFHTGTRVVLWSDPGGYDAYRVQRRFSTTGDVLPSDPAEGCDKPFRYSPIRGGLPDEAAHRVADDGWTLPDLQAAVDQFVIHYDACGSSRRCFEVLHDIRGLSVHFMLDVDGTIYQTLDLKERARHAGEANDRSIGVEIAQIGAYADPAMLDRWYPMDEFGRRLVVWPDPAARASALRPARQGLIRGHIHGVELWQYDFTPQQYRALAHLTAALATLLPRIRLDAPRDGDGAVRSDALSESEWRDHRGLIGHYHLTTDKSDPGPAFDWERLLRESRQLLPR